ncbi:hypothetical protein KEM56_003208 [Ascosphaera pollenicola]|nr:hypothetical protein KEM56_003208 [Ascosphaera pollenicola]
MPRQPVRPKHRARVLLSVPQYVLGRQNGLVEIDFLHPSVQEALRFFGPDEAANVRYGLDWHRIRREVMTWWHEAAIAWQLVAPAAFSVVFVKGGAWL